MAVRERTGCSGRGTEVLWEHLDKVGGKQPDCPPVAKQPACPPRAITRVEAFDEIAFNETEISLGLQRGSSQYKAQQQAEETKHKTQNTKHKTRTSPPHEYTARTQHGKRIGSGGGARTIVVGEFGHCSLSRFPIALSQNDLSAAPERASYDGTNLALESLGKQVWSGRTRSHPSFRRNEGQGARYC